MNGRRGFTLLAVLWIIIGLGVLAGALAQRAQHAFAVTRGTHDRIVGRWLAEGCLARWQALVNEVMQADPTHAGAAWRDLERTMQDSVGMLDGCDLVVHVDGRLMLTRATDAQLAALPGMTPEAIARIIEFRVRGMPITDLLQIEGLLSPVSKLIFDAHYAELTRVTTAEPDVWVVRARAHVGEPSTPMNVEARFVRGGTRAAVVRWVEW